MTGESTKSILYFANTSDDREACIPITFEFNKIHPMSGKSTLLSLFAFRKKNNDKGVDLL